MRATGSGGQRWDAGWRHERLALSARFGFDQLGLIRVEIVAETGNRASRRTAERAGARFEAIARHRLWIHGRPADAAVYALLPSDLEAIARLDAARDQRRFFISRIIRWRLRCWASVSTFFLPA